MDSTDASSVDGPFAYMFSPHLKGSWSIPIIFLWAQRDKPLLDIPIAVSTIARRRQAKAQSNANRGKRNLSFVELST